MTKKLYSDKNPFNSNKKVMQKAPKWVSAKSLPALGGHSWILIGLFFQWTGGALILSLLNKLLSVSIF